MDDERRLDAAVVKCCLVARKRPAVVADKQHERVVGDILFFQLGHHSADEAVEPRDLVVVKRVVEPRLGRVGDVRRQANILRLVRLLEDAFVVVAMRIERGEPKEKRFVPWTGLEQWHPLVAAAARIAGDVLHNLPGFGRLAGGKLKTGHVGFSNFIKTIFHCIAEMPLAGCRGPVAGGFQ